MADFWGGFQTVPNPGGGGIMQQRPPGGFLDQARDFFAQSPEEQARRQAEAAKRPSISIQPDQSWRTSATPNPGAQQVAPTFNTANSPYGTESRFGLRPGTGFGPLNPAIQPMAQPQQQNPNAPYADINTGGGQYPLSSVQGTGFMAPFNAAFNRPDPNQIAADPSFQFQMEQGTEALERSALARGTALNGGQLKALAQYGQGLASTFDDKYYGRAKGEYDTARDIFNQNKQSQFNVLNTQAQSGQQAATNQADIAQGQGNAAAAGTMRQGSAYGNLVQNAGDLGGAAYDQWSYNRQMNPNYGQQIPNNWSGPTPGNSPMPWYQGGTNPFVQSYG